VITAEWDIPFVLQTPNGNIPFNTLASNGTTPLGYYVLDPSKCKTGVARRVTRNNLAQTDGEEQHRKFRTGYVMELSVQLWQTIPDGTPACGGVLREMMDYLALMLNSIDNADGRITWTPSVDADDPPIVDRMLSPVRLLGPSGEGPAGFTTVTIEKDESSPLVTIGFALLSPLPYGLDAPEIVTALTDGVTSTIFNGGTVDDYPFFEIFGPTDFFVLVNGSNLDEQGNPKEIVYLGDTLPGGLPIGGGDFAEILNFQNTIYLNGNSSNLKPGLDIPNTDFFTLVPGENIITLTGASGEMHWQNAYA
jgi:hypothetical protein